MCRNCRVLVLIAVSMALVCGEGPRAEQPPEPGYQHLSREESAHLKVRTGADRFAAVSELGIGDSVWVKPTIAAATPVETRNMSPKCYFTRIYRNVPVGSARFCPSPGQCGPAKPLYANVTCSSILNCQAQPPNGTVCSYRFAGREYLSSQPPAGGSLASEDWVPCPGTGNPSCPR